VAVAAAVTGVTWAVGQLAGLLFRFTWAHVSIGASLSIAARLPRHLADPRQAWPTAARSQLPGAGGFIIAALVILAVASVVMLFTVRQAGRRSTRRGFASPRDLDSALSHRAVLARGPVVRPSLAGQKFSVDDVGVRLGRAVYGGMPLAITAESSVLLAAAPRIGKTSQVVIPWLHAWPGPAMVTSVRPDVLLATATLRARGGRPVAVMAPTGMLTWPDMVRWSPASGCADFGTARQRAGIMVTIGKSGATADSGNAAYFGMTATNLLAGWLHAAAVTGRPMGDVLAWALDERLDEPVKLLRDHPDAAPGTAAMLDAIYRSPEGTRSNLWTTVQTAIAPLLSAPARAAFAPGPGASFNIEAFLTRGGTIYLLVSEKQAGDLAPLIAAFVDEVTETAKRLADRAPGGRLDPCLGLFLDEVANVSPLPHLPELMSFAGGSGMFILAVVQNMAQAEKRWGKEGAAMLWGAATVKIAFGGLSGEELREFSALAGDYREALTTLQRGSGGYTMQTTLHDRKTITPGEVRTLSEADRQALVVHATTPAVLVRMQRHYEGPNAQAFADAVKASRRIAGLDEPRPRTARQQSGDAGHATTDGAQTA
jgi:type IV secretion system protein VirD4